MKISKISDHPCPKCGSTNMWPQLGNKEEQEQGVSYRVCQNHSCSGRIKVKWNEENKTIKILSLNA